MRLEAYFKNTAERATTAPALSEWTGNAWRRIDQITLLKCAIEFSEALKAYQLEAGERVLLITRNRIQALVVLFGLWFAKLTAVLIDPDLPEADLIDQCIIADARCAIIENTLESLIVQKLSLQQLGVLGEDGVNWKIFPENVASRSCFQDCRSDIATLLFTSGTTGDYQTVMLTHANYLYLAGFYDDLAYAKKDNCSVTVLPLFHVAGLFCGFLKPLFIHAHVILFRTLSLEALQSAFLEYHPTVLISVPRLLEVLDQKIQETINAHRKLSQIIFQSLVTVAYFLNRYLHCNIGKLLFRSLHQKFGGRLRKILCGSAQLSPNIQRRFLSLGFEILCSYGLTESCGPITFGRVSQQWKLGSVGLCLEKKDLSISEEGEVLYRGPALMEGYFRNEKATKQAIIDGYLHTRDLGKLDRFGNLYILGRIKELIIFSDGKKGIPEHIEKQYAMISGIKEYAVFGVRYDNKMLAVIAFVPTDEKQIALITHALFQRASQLKSPYRISDVMVMNALPRSSTLKVKRHQLAADYLDTKRIGASTKIFSSSGGSLSANKVNNLIFCFQLILPHKKNTMTADTTFAELGIDSLLAAQLCECIENRLGYKIDPTIFWFARSIGELQACLTSSKSISTKISHPEINENNQDIAIIAMEGVFPGASNNDVFFNNLLDGGDAIIEIPASRWNVDDYYDPYLLTPGKTNSRYGGFIDAEAGFSCEKFNIKPRIAEYLDPQQKILLTITQRLLNKYCGEKIDKNIITPQMGFYIGVGFSDFMIWSLKHKSLAEVNPYFGMGMADFSSIGHVAHYFNFQGPAMIIKTACSSSLVAIHQAVRALQSGDCTIAMAGGVNLVLVPEISVCLTKGGFLSPEGRCKSFDANANGYVRSEGCGLVLLKRYKDAVRDGDTILSVIVGSHINQDGESNAMAAPNGKAQAKCYQAALDKANINPHAVTYIEAHGSGTQLGDAIEMQSIQMIYDQARARDNTLYVGAVKSNIGHAESAAGIAGFMKTVAVLQHQKIPRNLHYYTPNPNISFANSSVVLPVETVVPASPIQYAAVSSFGVAGTNAHVVLRAS